MTQEEKAKEIYKDNLYDCEVRGVVQDEQEILFMLEKMAKWKEEQMIEKACEWLDSIMYYVSKEDKRLVCDFTDFDGLVNDFKKAMEE